MTTPTLQDLHNALNDGSLESASSETLKKYLILLSQGSGPWKSSQEYIVIGNTINHIIMQRHIDSLNTQNTKTQRWVIILAIAALISTFVQTVITVAAYLSPPVISSTVAPVGIQLPQKEEVNEIITKEKTP